ncbi:hypothetical protein [Flavobacterium sp. Root901]|uniref:hypothetical protein n=1 Tax=Flavobacterium sp. Root901 TaxID=1736605 RepID=UPI000AA78824|nr:hypothetical protein [Flavobacterium sp. Root901]
MKNTVQNTNNVNAAKITGTETKVQDDKTAGKNTVTKTTVKPSAKDMKDSLPTKK